jgi:hypothetical protein
MQFKLKCSDLRLWLDIPRKKQGTIFVISYYRITISCDLWYLQGITFNENYIFMRYY